MQLIPPLCWKEMCRHIKSVQQRQVEMEKDASRPIRTPRRAGAKSVEPAHVTSRVTNHK